MPANANLVVGNQRIVVLSPTRRVEIINGGPGPQGPPGPDGLGSGGFNYIQTETPVATEEGQTWYETDSARAYVWYDSHWIQFAPGGEIGPPGPPGPVGPSGSAAQTYVHVQATPASVWNITHNLPYIPNITLADSANTQLEGMIVFTSATTITVTLSAATAGKAYLS